MCSEFLEFTVLDVQPSLDVWIDELRWQFRFLGHGGIYGILLVAQSP
ncbi:hypothetical protein AF72_07280 [Xylella taiwanensis]|uniref:Uncharacterized protein n=1 Tax=Xylella taiwanensis TaxID=1444770 RepID=Z9JK54_9GAMM|nr:hypothetical protein AF72_07280 [Xylella taiwanensis]